MTTTAPIPLTILTGFLGAGKTTLLNRLLRDPALADTVVLVNEFGEIGLDHLLIEAVSGDMVLLASGCLCCTVRGDLVAALEDLIARRDEGRVAPFRRAVIETTGLADPAPVLQAVMSHPYLATRYAIDGVVTAVDAVNGDATLDMHAEAVKQVAVADRLALTKTDLATDPAALAALKARLRRLAPGARILDVAKGEATAEALLDAGPFDASAKIPDVARWLNEEAYRDAAGHEGHHHAPAGEGQDAHDVNRHDEHIRAFSFATDRPVSMAALDMFLTLLPSAHGAKILRMKGIVKTVESPDRPIVVHGVQHVLHPPVMLPAWPDADRRTRLVFITRDLPEDFVRKMWDAFAGTPRIDEPDAQALMHNPLAIPRGDG
ncbi:GTP-binding protein [Alsobacter sp. SYSU M60028]|uniref:GTP-binding protein n=1 Tax=Alsobacter ponti TaxID=2962936 RepID=A0ABT1LIZ6_9HYPH|nr:GTP-binding protein [Alsobacter ponti]MCP8940685.1 GTP-binding protein [Alsobacter ponti]